jgi:hypothetical protein
MPGRRSTLSTRFASMRAALATRTGPVLPGGDRVRVTGALDSGKYDVTMLRRLSTRPRALGWRVGSPSCGGSAPLLWALGHMLALLFLYNVMHDPYYAYLAARYGKEHEVQRVQYSCRCSLLEGRI